MALRQLSSRVMMRASKIAIAILIALRNCTKGGGLIAFQSRADQEAAGSFFSFSSAAWPCSGDSGLILVSTTICVASLRRLRREGSCSFDPREASLPAPSMKQRLTRKEKERRKKKFLEKKVGRKATAESGVVSPTCTLASFVLRDESGHSWLKLENYLPTRLP